MPLKAVVADINTVDEAHRPLYVKKDDKFVLDVSPAEGFELDNVSGLKNALGAERNNVSVLKAQLQPYEGLDAAAARTAIANLTAFGEITPEAAKTAIETANRLSALDPQKEADKIVQAKLDATVNPLKAQWATAEQAYKAQIETAAATNTSLTGQLEQLMRDNAIKSELAKLNPLDDARDAIELLATTSVKTKIQDGKVIVQVVDVNGAPRIKDAQGTPLSVGDFLAELKEARPALFKADDKRGLGTQPGGGKKPGGDQVKNPWAKETFNITQQMLLENTKPDLAKRFKSEAGVED